jgi:peptidoglycan/LPS O-acetylase OafA/YrhL
VPRIVAAYIVPFAFGWLLYQNRDLLPSFQRHAWKYILAAALLVAVRYLLPPSAWALAAAPLRALFFWLVAFGLMGLFQRYLNSGNPSWRYLADGSYWIYIMHMPVVMAFQMSLAPFAIPTAGKVWIVLLCSVVTLVASYDLLARPTWVGVLLNGRRYPRRFFWSSALPRGGAAQQAQGVVLENRARAGGVER